MPNFPILDTHRHLWDHSRLKYDWTKGNPLFERNYHIEDFIRDCGPVAIEAMVFPEGYADFNAGGGQYNANGFYRLGLPQVTA